MSDAPHIGFDHPHADELEEDATLWALYDAAFPASERDPRDVMVRTVETGAGWVTRARGDDATVGFACVHALRDPAVPFLLYLVVAPELRQRKIGRSLFERAWEAAASHYGQRRVEPAGMVWEVEIPERAADAQDRAQRLGRIAFFEQLDAVRCPGAYLQPPIDGIAPVPMYLMYRPAPGRSLPDNAELNRLVRAIYGEKYQAMNGISRNILDDLLRATNRAS